MSRKNQAAQAAQAAEQQAQAAAVESTEEAQVGSTDAGVADSTEPDAPEGVATVEADTAPDQQAQAASFVVAHHVKAGGKLYQPGDDFPAELVADSVMASGAVVTK